MQAAARSISFGCIVIWRQVVTKIMYFVLPLLLLAASPWGPYLPWLKVIGWITLPLVLSALIGLATMRRYKKVCDECDRNKEIKAADVRRKEALRRNSG